MNRDEARRAVLEAIAAIAPETDPQQIRPELPLRRQLDLDSVDWLNVIVALHERLGIDIPEPDYERLTTLESIVAYAAERPASPLPAAAARPAQMAPLPRARYVINGVPVELRPLRADDTALEADFVHHLSFDARYKRFMTAVSELPPSKLRYLTDVDQVRHVALAATVERDGQPALAGVARYVVDPSGSGCEFAVAVDDAWQGSGLAGILMHALMDLARARGLATMEGLVLRTNRQMLKFTRQLGFRHEHDPEDPGTVRAVRAL